METDILASPVGQRRLTPLQAISAARIELAYHTVLDGLPWPEWEPGVPQTPLTPKQMQYLTTGYWQMRGEDEGTPDWHERIVCWHVAVSLAAVVAVVLLLVLL